MLGGEGQMGKSWDKCNSITIKYILKKSITPSCPVDLLQEHIHTEIVTSLNCASPVRASTIYLMYG